MVGTRCIGFWLGSSTFCPCLLTALRMVPWLPSLLWCSLLALLSFFVLLLAQVMTSRFWISVVNSRRSPFSASKLCLWASFLSLWGVGEALTPGPSFVIGVANMNGLNNKAFGFAESDVDAWILSETHLTKGGISTFRSQLRQAHSPYTAFVHGCPVAPRSVTSDIGQFSGVGVLTHFPSRRLPHSWPDVAFNSGRLLCSGFCAKGVWISGVTLYGTPTGPTHVNGREVTDELLGLALERVLQLTGPRFIAGDFNHDLDRLSTIATMERLGFRDIQDINAERTGVLPVATCRGKTRRDYLFISRELALLFQSCHVDDDSISDHSYLIGHFQGDRDALDRFVWPTPDPMEWTDPSVRACVSQQLFVPGCSLDSDYEAFWQEVESHNNTARLRQLKPVVRAMTGRGRQQMPQRRHGQLAPTKTSRPGDRQPAFLGTCIQHAQWLKQLRRLQSYVRLSRSGVASAAHRAHQYGLWTAILRSPGFCPSFPDWWSQRSLAVGDPAFVPVTPPDQHVAWLFYAGLEMDFEQLEKSLHTARSHAHRLAKASDVSAMYRSVQRDAPVQVDSLVGVKFASVMEVDEDECAVVTDKVVDWNLDAPLAHRSGPVSIIHAEEDKVWVDSCGGFQVGDRLSQSSFTTALPALFDAFETYWSGLWNKHVAVPDSQWDDIVRFATSQLRPLTPSRPKFSVNSIRRCLKRKSSRSATGLDGVSRLDLLALGDADLQLLLRTLSCAGQTGAWPQQVLNGYVRSLAKTEDPLEVGHYRPITVFSQWYRAWSSISARHWLAQLSQVVDPFLCGNVVGCRAGMVWRHVLEQVEAAHRDQTPICGYSADIVKAFNVLPRRPVFIAAKLLGLDQATLVAWAGALSGFVRHFVVRGSVSPGVDSHNGFPEGCAMSCVAMLLLTQLFHKWMVACNAMFRPVSYVDNWAVLLHNVDHMRQATEAVDRFADMLQVQLDAKKCFAWCSHADGRKTLRAQGFRVLLGARELGAHVVYTRQLANKTAVDRFKCLDDFWAKLTSTWCTFRQKLLLVSRVAWPRAMHAISAVVVGRKHFESLRTQMMQSLHLQKPGANPVLQCGLEGLTVDPLVFAAVETFRDARALGVDFSVVHDLNAGPFGCDEPQFNSLSEILCQRLHQVGFTPHPHGLVADSVGLFRFLECPFGELMQRLQLAWTSIMAVHVQHRPSFRGFQCVDVALTRKAYAEHTPYDQGILRKHLHGATLTNAHAQHWSDNRSDLCIKCGSLDSSRHRLWECPATQHFRDSLPLDFVAAVPSLPAVVTEHGWTWRPCLANAWLKYLDSLSCDVVFQPCGALPSVLDVFTDGSCLFPTCPSLRVASWAVVLGLPFRLDFSALDFQPLAGQPLPGLVQTAYRAELYAIMTALKFAVKVKRGIRIWTDCQSALDAFASHVRDGIPVRANSKHCDLLFAIQRLASEVGFGCVEVLKVPAHAPQEAFDNDLERWLVCGNGVADRVAKAANTARDPTAWSLWSAFSEQLELCQEQATLARSHILAVSKFWSDAAETPMPAVPQVSRPMRVARTTPELVLEMPQELALSGSAFRRFFGLDLFVSVSRWISRIRAPEAALQWISFHQLYISFQKREGPIHVFKVGGQWKVETGAVASLSNHQKLGPRVKYFRLMLQQFLKDCGVRFVTATVRPASQWVCCFKGSLAFGITPEEYSFVEGFLASQLLEPSSGSGKSLDRLRL